ncbi:hypothetical protein JMUB6875_68470 [Nocardia sp. JMUB6875]
MLSGCSGAVRHNVAVPVCTSTFDISAKAEVLGSNARLNDEIEKASKRSGTFQAVDITRAAGWSDDWDRMVQVRVNVTMAKLNRNAGTASCFKNLPESDGEGYRPTQFYLFVKDGKPVQSVPWPNVTSTLQFGDGVLTKDSVLSVDAKGWIVPQQ